MKNVTWKLWIFVAVVAVALVMFGTACATGDKGQKKQPHKLNKPMNMGKNRERN